MTADVLREATAHDFERSGRTGDVPDGFVLVVVVQDDRWRAQDQASCARLLPAPVGGNRHVCRQPAVAALNRQQNRRGGKRDAWWPYCPDHLYGRWVEDGQVVGLRMLREEAISSG